MESNGFRKLLLIFAVILIVPIMNALYGAMSAIITALLVIGAIIIIITHFATRSGNVPRNRGICADIHSINIKVCGRSYIISEGDGFNTEDHEQDGILSYIENGVWFIQDNPAQTIKGAIAEITIPKDITLDALDINVLEGNLLINSASAKRCAISVHNDFAQIKSLITNSLAASVGKGKLMIGAALNGNATLSCGSGTLEIEIDDNIQNFNIEALTGSGTVSLNGKTFLDSSHRNEKINNGAANTIKASCGLGKLDISFMEVLDNEN